MKRTVPASFWSSLKVRTTNRHEFRKHQTTAENGNRAIWRRHVVETGNVALSTYLEQILV